MDYFTCVWGLIYGVTCRKTDRFCILILTFALPAIKNSEQMKADLVY